MTFPALSEQTFWFVGAGLAFWYTGAINLARQASAAGTVNVAAFLVNLTLLVYAVSFDTFASAIMRPKAWVIIGCVALETVYSLTNLRAKPPTGAACT